MAQTVIVFLIATVVGLLSATVLTLNILSIINDGPDFWNIFWVVLIGSGYFATSSAKRS